MTCSHRLLRRPLWVLIEEFARSFNIRKGSLKEDRWVTIPTFYKLTSAFKLGAILAEDTFSKYIV